MSTCYPAACAWLLKRRWRVEVSGSRAEEFRLWGFRLCSGLALTVKVLRTFTIECAPTPH